MEKRPLGTTGLSVSPVAFGTSPVGELFGPLDEADALRLVDRVVDAGIDLIDTSPYYGNAEERIGKALTPAKRDRIVLATKAGRYGESDFDFSPARVRTELENSLRRLRTDHVDILQFHDIEFADLGPVLTDGYAELLALKDEGKCRFIGMTGYPLKTFKRVMTETKVDVVLTYAKGTLLDDSLREELVPLAEQRGIGLINAAAVSLGLLTPSGSSVTIDAPWPQSVQDAANRMIVLAARLGVDIAFLANQYAIQRSGAATTVIGSGKWRHVQSAIEAASTPIDEELLARFIALRPPVDQRPWTVGLPENN